MKNPNNNFRAFLSILFVGLFMGPHIVIGFPIWVFGVFFGFYMEPDVSLVEIFRMGWCIGMGLVAHEVIRFCQALSQDDDNAQIAAEKKRQGL